VLREFLLLLSQAEVFSVIALRRKALFFPTEFPRDFSKLFMSNFFLRFNGGDQVEIKMIGKNDLVPDIHCLLIISPKSRLPFHLKAKHINQVT